MKPIRSLLACLLGALTAAAADKLNVLLICVDDLKPLLGCYGDTRIRSPHMDRLAARGVLFERAFCNQAVCAPSRNALMTGRRPTTLGIYDLGTNFRKALPDAVTLAQYFKQHGWRAEALGKIFHVGHGNHEDPASWTLPHWGPRSGPAGGYVLKENRPPQQTREEALFQNVPWDQAAKLPKGAATECADVPDNAYGDGKIADEAILRLRAAKDKPAEPFFLAVGFLKPHLPFVAPKKYWDLYQQADFKLPALQTPPAGAPAFAPTTWGELRAYSDIPDAGPITPERARHLIHGYHACVSFMDAQLGRVLDELDRLGLAQDTIIVLWGDHGWHLGDHGMWCKHTNYEQASRIPLLVAVPGVAQAGARTGALAETVDLYPTLCELAGLPIPAGLDGMSLAPALKNPDTAKTKEAVFHVFPRSPKGMGELIGRAVRTERYRLVEWKEAAAAPDTAILELYDYVADPEETRNLADAQPAVVAQLRALLAKQPEARPQLRAPAASTKTAAPKQDRAAMFARRDNNKDGHLTRAEFLEGQPDPPPNILFCFADDWGRYANIYTNVETRPSLNQLLYTPNIDRMARQGVLFKNAFVTAPSCTPCRSSLLSGQYFFRTGRGAILQGAIWDTNIPSYPLLLRDAGYHIGKSYKVWSPGTPADAPYGGQKHGYEKAGRAYNDFSENATRMVREGMTFAAAKDKLLGQVRDNFAAFLADRKPGQPFCFWFGPTLTHRAYEKGSGQALWGLEPDALKGRLPKFMPDVPEVRADVTDYMGEIQAWDAGVGVLLKKLEDIGELDKTLVVISGDHGMPGVPGGKCNLYDHGVGVALIARGPGVPGGRIVDDFVNLMDLAPTFLEAGGVKPPAAMIARSFLNVLRSEKSGRVDPTRTWVVTGRERHVAAAREGNLPYPHRALRTPDFLYIRNFAPDRWPLGSQKFEGEAGLPSFEALEKNTFVAFADMDASPTKAWLVRQFGRSQWQWHYDYAFGKRPAEELYDLRNDPDETTNLAADPAFAARKLELSERLLEILADAKDPRVTGDGRTFECPPFTDAQEANPNRKAADRSRGE